MHLSDVNKIIKERRALLGITQQDLADISGIGLRTIKAIEANRGNPSINTLLKIVDVLGMELKLKIKKTIEE
jgi:transcriptional regulator with XRE-family HTH domain